MERKPKVLIAEDEREIARLAQLWLSKSGFDVVTASDGQETLEKSKTEKPDVVLINVVLPRMGGWEVIKRLREDPETARIRIILFTACDCNEQLRTHEGSGVLACIAKPCAPQEIVTVVRRCLQEPRCDVQPEV